MGFPLYIICHFSLVAFSIFSVSFIFVSLITVCHRVFLLVFILPGTLCASWTWLTISLFPVREDFGYYLFKYFLRSFLSFPSWIPIMSMLVCLMLSQKLLRLSSVCFVLFFLFFFFIIILFSSDFHHSVL